jgi:hypothetical protein
MRLSLVLYRHNNIEMEISFTLKLFWQKTLV